MPSRPATHSQVPGRGAQRLTPAGVSSILDDIFCRFKERYPEYEGLNLTPHSLRHSYAMMYYLAGVPLSALQRLMRHRDINTTAIYLEMAMKDLRRLMEDAHRASMQPRPPKE